MKLPDAKLSIVVTGLPASGKSTLGQRLADHIRIPILDKDDYLERLYEQRGWGDENTRIALSRESDILFREDASRLHQCVLVSHWQPPKTAEISGTPGDWLNAVYDVVIELCCHCPPGIALHRFFARDRHPGHLDQQRDLLQTAAYFSNYSRRLPLGLGPVISVDTANTYSLEPILATIGETLQTQPVNPGNRPFPDSSVR